MADLNDFIYTDGVHDVLAVYVNRILAATLRSEYKNVETLLADKTLADADTPLQRLDCNGANRIVKVPTGDAVNNHPFLIINATAGNYILTVKSNDGSSTLHALGQGEIAYILPDGNGGYKDLIALGLGGTIAAQLDFIPGGRLTLTSGTPVTVSDVTGATSIYYAPFIHNKVLLWDGSVWRPITFSEITLALGTITSGLPYDVFAYISAGVLALEKLAWTNGTTRATGISIQDGRYCKTGDKTRLYLGTFYTTSTTTTEDSAAKRLLFNMYNRTLRKLKVVDTTNSWTYSTTSWRAWNNSNANRVEVMVGLADSVIDVNFNGLGSNSAGFSFGFGIGIDSITVNSADTYTAAGSSGSIVFGQAAYDDPLSVGYHYIQALEQGGGSGTTTFYGDAGVTYLQAGLIGKMMM